jgi:hypothetical protein
MFPGLSILHGLLILLFFSMALDPALTSCLIAVLCGFKPVNHWEQASTITVGFSAIDCSGSAFGKFATAILSCS